MSYGEKCLLGRNVSLREKIGEKCLLGRKVLGRNVLERKYFWGETSEYHPEFAVAFDSPTIKAITVTIYFLVIPIGCLLHFLVIHYEQFGGDPQKRSILNQIIAYISGLEISNALVFEHIFAARVFFGCLPREIATLIWFCIIFKNSVLLTFIVIAVTYKAIKIFSFR